ncbi:MAG: 2Fe-2S iron-sulfur cluster binding domain-containing protein [bacterium]|nr:2Fe-2S iron-sulfur cluster binding domain-containing protein [bacterium]
MTQLLSVSKAVRLAGISRRKLQEKIGSGELPTFEGKVRIEDLLRVFPRIDLDANPTLEQIVQIKSKSKPMFDWQQRDPPSAEILLRRLQSLSTLFLQTQRALDQNSELLKSTVSQLDELSRNGNLGEIAQGKISSLFEELSHQQSELNAQQDQMLEAQNPADAKKQRHSHNKAVLFTKNLLMHIIAPSVQIIPSGHEFLIEGGDTVLEAATRSGVNVNYGCNDGKCGGCKARLISGQVVETRTPGYKLSAHEKKMGYVLMCCNTAITDLTLEAGEAAGAHDLPEQELETHISGLQQLNDDRVLLHLRAPKSENFRFLAGQKATLTLADGVSLTRSIISCPCDGENLYFIVQRGSENPLLTQFYDGLQLGAKMQLVGPKGEFCLQNMSTNPSLFIADDAGFAPVKSLVEHAISIDRIKGFNLYRQGSKNGPSYYHNLCRSWQDAFENFNYINLQSDVSAQDIAVQIMGDHPDPAKFDVYIAGVQPFADTLKDALLAHGFPAARLRLEIMSDDMV